MRRALPIALLATTLGAGCTLFLAGDTPCDSSADCSGGLVCQANGFCGSPDVHGIPGDVGEGEGAPIGEGEGAPIGEGEGAPIGEGEGAPIGEGEGEGVVGGEGEGVAGEGEGVAGEGEGVAGEGEGAGAGEGEGGGGEGEGEGGGGPATITLCGQQHVEQAWAAPAFPFRVAIGLCDNDAATPSEDVVGLPVPISLTAGAFPEIDSIAADGRDVLFFDDPGNALPYERQIYVDGSSAVFNVRVPRFNPRVGGDAVWMYFGSADGVERSNAAAAFPDYASVWHLDSSTTIADARTGGTPANSIGFGGIDISPTTGFLGGGINFVGRNGADGESFAFLQPFNGNNGALVTPPSPPPSSAASYSLIANPRSFSTGGQNGEFTLMLSDLGTPASPCVDGVSICSLFFNDGSFQVFVPNSNGVGLITSGAGVVPLNQFKHESLSWSSSGIQATFDGRTVIDSSVTVNAGFAVGNIVLGMAEQDGNGPFNGVIDEVRISNVPRAASFYRAESKAFAGLLLQRSAVEAGP